MSGSRIWLRSGKFVDVPLSPAEMYERLARPGLGLLRVTNNGEATHVIVLGAIEAVIPL